MLIPSLVGTDTKARCGMVYFCVIVLESIGILMTGTLRIELFLCSNCRWVGGCGDGWIPGPGDGVMVDERHF